MEILAYLLVGLIVGAIIKLTIEKDTSESNWGLNIFLGMLGSLVGGFLSVTVGFTTENLWGFGTIATSIAGATGVVLLYRIFSRY